MNKMQTPFNVKEMDMGDFNMGLNNTHEMHRFPSTHALPTQQTRQNPSPISHASQYAPVDLEESFQSEITTTTEDDEPRPIDESHVFHPQFADEMLYDASNKSSGSKAKSFFKRYWWIFLLVVLLGVGGLAWWYYNKRKSSYGTATTSQAFYSSSTPTSGTPEAIPTPQDIEKVLTSL